MGDGAAPAIETTAEAEHQTARCAAVRRLAVRHVQFPGGFHKFFFIDGYVLELFWLVKRILNI